MTWGMYLSLSLTLYLPVPFYFQLIRAIHVCYQDVPLQKSWLRSLLPSTRRQLALGDTPVETYFLPISETQLLISMDMVNKLAAPPLRSLNSIALAADGTVVWYDHWEDGYETVSVVTEAGTLSRFVFMHSDTCFCAFHLMYLFSFRVHTYVYMRPVPRTLSNTCRT